MEVLKTVGYVVLAMMVLVALAVGGGFISAILVLLSLFLIIAAVVAFIAGCIKEYCEPEPNDPKRGNKEGESQD